MSQLVVGKVYLLAFLGSVTTHPPTECLRAEDEELLLRNQCLASEKKGQIAQTYVFIGALTDSSTWLFVLTCANDMQIIQAAWHVTCTVTPCSRQSACLLHFSFGCLQLVVH